MRWHPYPLHLPLWPPHWQQPRCQARFHPPLWQPFAQLLRQRSLLRLWQLRQWLLPGLQTAWLQRRSTELALQDHSMLQRHCPTLSWPLSLRRLPLWRQWPHWQLPCPSWLLWRLSLFRWQLRKLLRRCPPCLQRWQQHGQLSRWQARFHQPLWRQLARLSLPMLRLQLLQRHQQLKRALRLAWLRHRSTDLALPDRSMLQRHRPKRSWLLSLRWLPLWRQWPHWLLPWPMRPLSRLSLFRWQLRKLLQRCPLYLQRWQQHWQLPRCQARLRSPLWLRLAQLLRQRSLLRLRLQRPQPRLALRLV
jgi:hypothetical protein